MGYLEAVVKGGQKFFLFSYGGKVAGGLAFLLSSLALGNDFQFSVTAGYIGWRGGGLFGEGYYLIGRVRNR